MPTGTDSVLPPTRYGVALVGVGAEDELPVAERDVLRLEVLPDIDIVTDMSEDDPKGYPDGVPGASEAAVTFPDTAVLGPFVSIVGGRAVIVRIEGSDKVSETLLVTTEVLDASIIVDTSTMETDDAPLGPLGGGAAVMVSVAGKGTVPRELAKSGTALVEIFSDARELTG